MDIPATSKQVNSDTKGYYVKIVRNSNIPLDYIVDNKLGHYWYNYVIRDVLSYVTEENFTHLIQIQVSMNKRGQGGGEVIYPKHNIYDNIHWLRIKNKALNYCIIIYNQTFLVIYVVFPNNNYNIMNHNRNMYFYDEGGGGGGQAKPILSLSYISVIIFNPF